MLNDHLTWKEVENRLHPILAEEKKCIIPATVDPLENNQYNEAYAWMYATEKAILHWLERESGKSIPYDLSKTMFGVDGGFSEGLSNAFVHGNKKDSSRPIWIDVLFSQKGVGFSIKDSGKGFDVKHVAYGYSNGLPFFHIAGNGFKALNTLISLQAGYEEGGTRLNLKFDISW